MCRKRQIILFIGEIRFSLSLITFHNVQLISKLMYKCLNLFSLALLALITYFVFVFFCTKQLNSDKSLESNLMLTDDH